MLSKEQLLEKINDLYIQLDEYDDLKYDYKILKGEYDDLEKEYELLQEKFDKLKEVLDDSK